MMKNERNGDPFPGSDAWPDNEMSKFPCAKTDSEPNASINYPDRGLSAPFRRALLDKIIIFIARVP